MACAKEFVMTPQARRMASMTRIEILQAALTLPPEERLTVAREIAYSVESEGVELSAAEWDAAWAEEADRRLLEIEQGKVKEIPGEEVMARVRAIVRS
jgi:putative addiction module component (TIGR02574 family)